MSYTYKVWIADGKEHFKYGNDVDSKRTVCIKKDLPFAESLMELLYFDIWSLNVWFESMGKALANLYETKEQSYADEVLIALNVIAKKHIFFEQLRLDWQERLAKAKAQNYVDIMDLLPRRKLTQLPSNIHTMQEQIKNLFAEVLDLDTSGKGVVQKKMVDYYNTKGGNSLNTFQFHPQSMCFEVIGKKTFTEVLYPKDIYDIIDYLLRECVKREQPTRVCKNCGRYFAIAGRISGEYCDRAIDSKGHTCKSMGSINQWNEKRKSDDVFKVYRREYKKRFGWIKAGKIEQDAFYAWSEKAREEKAKCDVGEISLQEFEQWLSKG